MKTDLEVSYVDNTSLLSPALTSSGLSGVRCAGMTGQKATMAHWVTMVLLAIVLFAAPESGIAEEELGFTAEHMIETQMDARYLALPEIELQTEDDRSLRFDIGYMTASGGLTTSSTILLGVQGFRPLPNHERWAVVLGGFLDLIRFDGTPGIVSIDPTFTSTLPVVAPLDAEVLDVTGDALHAGLSFAAARRISERWAWQAGVALEYYDIDPFKVKFRALGPIGFDGEVGYAGNYNSITPYLTFRHLYPRRSERFVLSSRFLMAWPLPRRGFHGQISGPGFSIEGDSESAGRGRHIPDGFAGIGFGIESVKHRWRVDVGASLWLLLAENKGHEGVDPPLFLHFNMPFHAEPLPASR
jgi:hypothetical protein